MKTKVNLCFNMGLKKSSLTEIRDSCDYNMLKLQTNLFREFSEPKCLFPGVLTTLWPYLTHNYAE